MLKGRTRNSRAAGQIPPHLASRPPMKTTTQTRPAQPTRAPLAKPEPDYEVVEFPTDQYVNAKLQPPPPPPPRPAIGDAGASCGLCGGGGARVRCTECGRRALCASCDDMYHRHPKRRNHQRLALSPSQLGDERPPLPPKTTPPVPPPRRHKLAGDRSSASPMPHGLDLRRATVGHVPNIPSHPMHLQMSPLNNHSMQQQVLPSIMRGKPHALHAAPPMQTVHAQVGSMPYLPAPHHAPPPHMHANTLQHNTAALWGRQRGSLQGFNMPSAMGMASEPWESPESISPTGPSSSWGRPLRRNASVLELSGGSTCGGCAHCTPSSWRYGSCASLEPSWQPAWPPPPVCCVPHGPHLPHMHPHAHLHSPHTPQPYRRGESRGVSRAASRTGSRAASPAMSARSRTSRRTKHRTPSPPPLPSSDADSESESDSDRPAVPAPVPIRTPTREPGRTLPKPKPQTATGPPIIPSSSTTEEVEEDGLGPAPPPSVSNWQCEHCTFMNEPGVRVCVVCCRTPTTVPRVLNTASAVAAPVEPTVATVPVKDDLRSSLERLKLSSPSPVRIVTENIYPKQNGESTKTQPAKARASTGCGPSPPRDAQRPSNRLMTPTGDQTRREQVEEPRTRHDMAVGPSPPRDLPNTRHNMGTGPSPPRESNAFIRSSPYREPNLKNSDASTLRPSVSIGPSPPRDLGFQSSRNNTLKKSSPPRASFQENKSSVSTRTNVSNTGTSPPPQNISTQTYEVPNSWERVPSASRSRPQRRFQDDSRRERSHSRHSLSSDTRDSERSVHTSGGGGGGRWEWRETRDSSPGGEWSGSERRRAAPRLARRASHLDLRRTRSTRRSSFYGSEAASPEPLPSNRAISLEALAGAGTKREAERGLELARLMTDAERLGFSAAEVQAALAQNPVAPLAWLRDRWPSLCAGVRAAAARLAPGVNVSELEARAALARHRGAMWPAVTDCVERHRRQKEVLGVGEERRLRGHVWGSPVGADDDAAPPPTTPSVARRSLRARAEDSSDEFEAPIPTKYRDDDWMYLPLDPPTQNYYDMEPSTDLWNASQANLPKGNSAIKTEDIALKLKSYLIQAGVPSIDENLLLRGLLADNTIFRTNQSNNMSILNNTNILNNKQQLDLGQSEFDFIEAYNALTRSSPLPNINNTSNDLQTNRENIVLNHNEHTNLSLNSTLNSTHEDKIINQIQGHTESYPVETNVEQVDITEDQSNIATINMPKSLTYQNNTTVQKEKTISKPVKAIEHETNVSKTLLSMKKQKSKVPQTQEITAPPLNSVDVQAQPKHESNEERSNNLSDIVDNTQRLIQQMKAEINSDINSLDGQNMSQSEAENSSNESNFTNEHESSYSETEEQTDDLTSEENESSSDEKSEKNGPEINRTSSEDNEQFEEAMDHIEEQNENFRQTNMEILDSIARSLHEEHLMSVATNENHIKETINAPGNPLHQLATINRPIPDNNQATNSGNRKQDVNNNDFAAVSSFEEIYEQINTNVSTPFEIANKTKSKHPVSKPSLVFERHEILISTFKPHVAIQLKVTEQHQPTLNAVIENVESNTNLSNNVEEVNGVEQQVATHYTETELTMASNSVNNRSSPDKIENADDDDSSSDTSRTTVSPIKQNLNPNLQSEIIFHNEDTNETGVITPLNGSLNNQNLNLDHTVEAGVSNNGVKSKSHSPDSAPSITKNHNKNAANSKSNIPKLIRALTNKNKSKVEIKNSPKVIASKVPIRGGSIKHYPAPAPPKTNFGSIQNGTIKQLQTRLFSDKAIKMTVNPAAIIEVKPSTSTLNKKRPAPLPPSKPEEKTKSSPPKESPQKEKKPYFRESCRTEDEWTESDSEDSSLQIRRQNNDEPQRQPSPPPPITVRRVSGQLIDLARVRILEGSPERQARMLLAEGATENWEQAQLAVELVARGADTPAALLAALECIDLNAALTYLHQDCELCASRLPEHEMVSMLRCTHRCCRECARHYFTVQITERSIVDCVCPYCKEPELENLPEDAWLEYFAHLDIQLKTLIEIDTHELFQRKLRDRTLARDPNFRWCVECSSGFFVHPKHKKLRCPECKSVTCASCRKPWTGNHEGLSCEHYAKWLDDNDPERSVAAVHQHLRENGIECPRCHFRYSLSRGGCMHFTCTQCKYEFCYGCGKPFMMGAQCGLSEYCAKLGLHAHHPRNCLFYLRDKEPHELQTLLQMNNVKYETEAAEGNARCFVQLQRETPTGLVDTTCGSEAPSNYAGLCKNHYLEYLSRLVRAAHVDPLPLLGVEDLETLVRRAALRLPPRPYGTLEGFFKRALVEIVREKIPLD